MNENQKWDPGLGIDPPVGAMPFIQLGMIALAVLALGLLLEKKNRK